MKKAKNMYEFVSKTWNPLAGSCSHGCSYCLVERYRTRYEAHREKYSGEPRIIEKEMNRKFKEGDLVFVGNMNDLFADNVPDELILRILEYIKSSPAKFYLQTKNTLHMQKFQLLIPQNVILCTTIESSRNYAIYKNCLENKRRAYFFYLIIDRFEKHITIEPIMDFDLEEFVDMIKMCNPSQVNIGADSNKKHNLPEPPKEKVLELIQRLEEFTTVVQKENLKRIID